MKQYFTKIFVFFHLLVVTSCYPYETASQTSHGQISIPNLILENTDLDMRESGSLSLIHLHKKWR